MKKLILSLTALASLTMANSAFANLGDTKAESIKRYGEITSAEGNWIYFTGEVWKISEWINPNNGLVEAIAWQNLKGAAITLEQMQWIEKTNLPSKYHNHPNMWTKGDEKWVRGEHSYEVRFTNDQKYTEEAGITERGICYYIIDTMRAKLAIIAESNAQNNQTQSPADGLTAKLNI